MTDARAPQAGWYPDPTGSAAQRWWTGMSWSDHTRQPEPTVSEIIAPDVVAEPADVEADGASSDAGDADDDYTPFRSRAGKARKRNELAYRSVNCGVTSAILFVVTVICADLAWRVSPFGVLGWIAVALCLIGTGVAIMAILLAAVSFFRVRRNGGLSAGLTGFAFGLVFAFSIPLAGLALKLVLATFG
ncbi:DUF2510 domain-containing protein [Diaminobutyricibacter sp. McL0618]|uniref:DUF2510 domain-containing protein n=1 Tax=Leifsonia sp. McL0618 TaxID=3415677 RepID=UPI003CF84935